MALETSQLGDQPLRALPVGGAVATDIVARQFMGLHLTTNYRETFRVC